MSQAEIAPKYQMTFGTAERLGVFEQYRFFTPAVLYLHGRLEEAHLVDFLREMPGDCRLTFRRFERPIFRGLHTADGDRDWNHVLWAIGADYFPALENFLLSVSLIDQESRRVYRFGAQDVLVADPLHVDRSTTISSACPLLSIVAFGVNASHRRVSLHWDDTNPSASLPVLRHNPPDPAAVQFAKEVLVGENPDALLGELPPSKPVDRLEIVDINTLPRTKQEDLLRDIQAYKKEQS